MIYLKKKFKIILLTLFGIGTAYAATTLIPDQPVGAVAPISATIQGKAMDFTYADETTNEDLIIRLQKQNFDLAVAKPIGGRPAETSAGRGQIYFAVTNASGIDQNVKVVAVTGGKTMVSFLAEVDAVNAKAIVSRRATRPVSSKRKAVVGNEIDVSDSTLILNGQTKYFLMEFRAAMAIGETEEFYLEAYGDKNDSYGHSY